ncbi:MAG: 50S ribosomal protein L19 [Planctomycetes bacterium]|nr:50S ribosomal protein L19 [Planctomycetota bacterium]
MNPIIKELEQEHAKKQIDDFMVGDTVDVHVRIIEGEKERIQIFNGVVIARNKGGINENFTVRRLVSGEGVERVFPLHAPRVEKVEIKRRGRTKRAKLYYLRDRIGKATRLKEETRPSRALPKAKAESKKK